MEFYSCPEVRFEYCEICVTIFCDGFQGGLKQPSSLPDPMRAAWKIIDFQLVFCVGCLEIYRIEGQMFCAVRV